MKIAVVGSGAMGSLYGGLLSEGGNDVTLIDIWREHIEKIREKGLMVRGVSGERVIRVKAATNPEEVGVVDLVLIFVKSYDTLKAAEDSKPLISPETTVLTLQNGLGNAEKIASVVGEEKVVAGITTYGSTLIKPGEILHAGIGETVIGELNGSLTPRVKMIAETFNDSKIKTRISRNIKSVIWGKLIVNAAINPLTALTEMKNGELLKVREVKQLLIDVVKETVKVAEAFNVTFEEDPIQKTLLIAEKTAENKSSMLQDMLKGRKTEVDAITGEIVKLGEKLNVKTPINKAILALIKGKEWRREIQGVRH